jgi:hypothetical protein
MRSSKLLLSALLVSCITSIPLLAAIQIAPDQHISGSSTWTSINSPYQVTGDLTIDSGATLVIEPGVEVRLAEGASIFVQGTLKARGARGIMIQFLPEESGTHWGHLLFNGSEESIPSYDEKQNYRQGNILEYCVFEGGGNVPQEDYNGGTVACIQASPVIQDCRFIGNRAPRGGAILCHRFSAPLIRRNTISENQATVDDGGGIYVFLYADPIIEENYFLRNQAARSGGAVYISAAEALLRHNILINNSASEYGGAVYLSSTSAVLEENAFLHNSGRDGSGTLYLVADTNPTIKDNSLAGPGYMVYMDNVIYPVDLSENWWQTVNEVEVELKLHTTYHRREAVAVNYLPLLSHPPESLPTQPVELKALKVMADRSWTEELRYDLALDARIHVQIEARDRNPWSRDQTAARLYVLGKPMQSFELILRETDVSSGIYRGEAWVRHNTNPFESEIGAAIGDTIVVESTVDPLFHTQYHIGESVPFVDGFKITSEVDITHVINPAIEMSWNYFDLRQHPQEEIQLQIATSTDFEPADVLDTGFFAHNGYSWVYNGARLEDGQIYYLRIRVSDGERISPWDSITIRNDNSDYSFRMNSLPDTPQPTAPLGITPVTVMQPLLQCQPAVDREGDRLSYEFELFETEFRRQLIASGTTVKPVFKPTAALPDNAIRWWRVRIHDGYEHTPWSELISFPVNFIEQPPAAPGLLEPFGNIAALTPLFQWLPTTDPDPMSVVHYYLQLSNTGGFASSEKMVAGMETTLQLPDAVANDVDYFWRVTAVDQTGRETRSKIGKFRADTRPSVPGISYPVARQELGTGQAFQAIAAIDPDPDDQLWYDLQIAVDADCRNLVAYEKDLLLDELNHLTALDLTSTGELQDDVGYYCRVRARDQHGITSNWSAVQEFILNLVNDPPAIPVLTKPSQMDVIHSTTPLLQWAPLTDPDLSDSADRLQLLLEFNHDVAFEERLTRSFLTDPGVTHFTLPDPLTDNSHWFLRWRAMDDEGAESPLAGPLEFVINTVEDPPSLFMLLEPDGNSALVELENFTLSWQEAFDSDPDASVVYHVMIATDPLYQNRLFSRENHQDISIQVPGPLPNATLCYWQVIAEDNTGLQTTAGGGSFLIDTTPTIPLPQHVDELRGGERMLWTPSEDPNPLDVISYTLQIWERDGSAIVATLTDIEQPELATEELATSAGLPDNSSWEYSLTAVDNHGITSDPSARDWFRLNLINDPPAVPAAGDASGDPFKFAEERLLVEWNGMHDPDFNDPLETLTARLQLDVTAEFNSPQLDVISVPAGDTSVELHTLMDNTRWYYRLKIVDDEGLASGWSVARSFIANRADEPPDRVTVTRPETGSQQADLAGIDLEFSQPSDPDWGDRVTTVVELATDQAFTRPLLEQVCDATSDRLNVRLNSGSSYFLRVICQDRGGLTSVSDVTSFSVDSHPTIPRLLDTAPVTPVSGSSRLEWHEVSDPDRDDTIRYEVEIARNSVFDNPVVVRSDLDRTSLSMSGLDLDEGVQYYWHVRAIDNHQLRSDFSSPGRFTLQLTTE